MSSRKFTLSTCLSSHVSVTKSLPGIILAPLLLSPPSVELVHLTMNSLISCPYCTDLHTNLGRMAGLEGSEKINECGGELKTIEKLVGDDEVHVGISKYALEFGTSGGPPNTKAGKDLLASVGTPARADAVTSLCWFLHWGGYSGNTLNDFYRRLTTLDCLSPEAARQFVFGAAFAAWYTPLFGVIVAVSKLITVFPTRGPWVVSQGMGVVLGCVASVWIVPVGVLGVVLGY